MLLKSSSPVHLELCGLKQFEATEYHVTRTYKYSVLILMREGILRFYEDGHPIELHSGEYYIQRAGLLQEGTGQYGEPPHPEGQPPVYLYWEFSGGIYTKDGNGIPLRGTYPRRITERFLSGECGMFSGQLDPFAMTAQLYQLLSELYASVPDKDPNEDLLTLVQRYIHSAYASPLTVSRLARQFNYNEDYLTRLFRRRFGITPGRYLRRVRMEQAHRQLLGTELSIEQIAAAVGYHDPSAFYRAFVAEYGISPGACRTT